MLLSKWIQSIVYRPNSQFLCEMRRVTMVSYMVKIPCSTKIIYSNKTCYIQIIIFEKMQISSCIDIYRNNYIRAQERTPPENYNATCLRAKDFGHDRHKPYLFYRNVVAKIPPMILHSLESILREGMSDTSPILREDLNLGGWVLHSLLYLS